MDFDKEDLITLDGIEYYVLLSKNVKDINYLYVAELDEDKDITENFYLYKEIGDNQWEKVVDSDELKAILPFIVKALDRNLG